MTRVRFPVAELFCFFCLVSALNFGKCAPFGARPVEGCGYHNAAVVAAPGRFLPPARTGSVSPIWALLDGVFHSFSPHFVRRLQRALDQLWLRCGAFWTRFSLPVFFLIFGAFWVRFSPTFFVPRASFFFQFFPTFFLIFDPKIPHFFLPFGAKIPRFLTPANSTVWAYFRNVVFLLWTEHF